MTLPISPHTLKEIWLRMSSKHFSCKTTEFQKAASVPRVKSIFIDRSTVFKENTFPNFETSRQFSLPTLLQQSSQ